MKMNKIIKGTFIAAVILGITSVSMNVINTINETRLSSELSQTDKLANERIRVKKRLVRANKNEKKVRDDLENAHQILGTKESTDIPDQIASLTADVKKIKNQHLTTLNDSETQVKTAFELGFNSSLDIGKGEGQYTLTRKSDTIYDIKDNNLPNHHYIAILAGGYVTFFQTDASDDKKPMQPEIVIAAGDKDSGLAEAQDSYLTWLYVDEEG